MVRLGVRQGRPAGRPPCVRRLPGIVQPAPVGAAHIPGMTENIAPDAASRREAARTRDAYLAALMHTSGSTGGPKGVMHCHGGLGFVTDSIIDYLEVVP